jgi:hypothetical protein
VAAEVVREEGDNMLFALFLLVCVAGAAAIAILLRDHYVFGQISEYITILQTNGDDSPEEYAFREQASETIADLCHLIRASRDDAKWKGLDKTNKRKNKSPRGKK